MPTYRLLIEYDGTDFRGWQAQRGGPTVQQEIERALRTVVREPVKLVGSGRTDAGVHARGQTAHFRTDGEIDTLRLRRGLEGLLPGTIAVRDVSVGRPEFHARYDAILRSYTYQVTTEPRALDRHVRWRLHPAPAFETMNAAAVALCGRHDFSAFCIARSATRNRECEVRRAEWVPEERAGNWRFEVEADRFVHGMVRAVVGTLVQIGRGARAPAELPDILASRDRRRAGPAAPPHGLVLERVEYANEATREPAAAARR